MKKVYLLILIFLFTLFSCSLTKYEETGTVIVTAKEGLTLIENGYILLDAQKKTSWLKTHVSGSPNIERNEITLSEPVPVSVAPASLISEAAGKAGISERSDILIYDDNNNMDSGRLFWTLKYYGHKGDLRIVSGGLAALEGAGANIVSGEETTTTQNYQPSPAVDTIVALREDIERLIDNPHESKILLDVRSDEEYNAGNIPGSVHINYETNHFRDGTFKSIQHIKIIYKEANIMPDDEIIIYCKSSVRAANTYVALYNSGYRNLKIYDGAWIEWSKSGNPIYIPIVELPTVMTSQDNS
jgi:thiosulfate/3-mercaptopyruvate sulfurtransferase